MWLLGNIRHIYTFICTYTLVVSLNARSNGSYLSTDVVRYHILNITTKHFRRQEGDTKVCTFYIYLSYNFDELKMCINIVCDTIRNNYKNKRQTIDRIWNNKYLSLVVCFRCSFRTVFQSCFIHENEVMVYRIADALDNWLLYS